jgi:thioredoxin-like negative regulator of GroEL
VLELVNKLDEAAKAYEEALSIDPSFVEAIGNLARVYVRMNRNDERTRQLLSELALKDTRPDWVNWARQRLALTSPASSPASAPASEP